ncbi:MAG: aminotransferase class IV [Candidatus Brocadiia bacterium]
MSDEASEHVYLNGKIIPKGKAFISPFDRGFMYGDGFFETTRIEDDRPLQFDRHFERIARSCRRTGWEWEPDGKIVRAACKELILRNEVETGYLRLTISRGQTGGLMDLQAVEPTVLIVAKPMELSPLDDSPAWILARAKGKVPADSITIGLKSASYQENLLNLAEGRRRGADEVYFLNTRNEIAECSISNIFVVDRGVLKTPSENCGLLPGIARQTILEICAQQKMPCEAVRLDEESLCRGEEVFCSNSLRGVIPVKQLLDPELREVSDCVVTARLQKEYARVAREESYI